MCVHNLNNLHVWQRTIFMLLTTLHSSEDLISRFWPEFWMTTWYRTVSAESCTPIWQKRFHYHCGICLHMCPGACGFNTTLSLRHFVRLVCNWLDNKFSDTWIGRGGPIALNPNCPNLIPSFLLVGKHEGIVYTMEVHGRNDLKYRVDKADSDIVHWEPQSGVQFSVDVLRRRKNATDICWDYVKHIQCSDCFKRKEPGKY